MARLRLHPVPWCPASGLAVGSALLGLLLVGCGSSGPPPPWRTGHPDPVSMALLDAGQAGSCASSAPDPTSAPAAISFQGQEFVQSSLQPAQAQPAAAVEIDHTGDWAFFEDQDGDLTMTSPGADYLYVPGKC